MRPAAPQAESLAPIISQAISGVPLLTPVSFATKEKSYQAVVLPGNDTREVGAKQLEKKDLRVPVQRGTNIELSRRFHSFFRPADIFGGVWSLDLPRLEPQRIPPRRDGDKTTYQTVYQLTSPFNTWSARFARIGFVPEIKSKILVPDTVDKTFLGIAADNDQRIGQSTQLLLLRDGRRWHFDEQGNLAAREDTPLLVVYRRDRERRIQRIEGWYGKHLHAEIHLEYDDSGRVLAVRGSNNTIVTYKYDEDSGQLLEVEGSEGVTNYLYRDGLVTTVMEGGQIIEKFLYNEHGQLQSERQSDGTTKNGMKTCFSLFA